MCHYHCCDTKCIARVLTRAAAACRLWSPYRVIVGTRDPGHSRPQGQKQDGASSRVAIVSGRRCPKHRPLPLHAMIQCGAMVRVLIAVAAVIAAAILIDRSNAAGGSPIRFEEVSQRAKVDFTANSSPTPNKNQPETMLSGVGLIDYDNDGYLDIYFVNGAALPSLRKESPKYLNRLLRNNHDGTFTDVTEKAGVGGDGYDMGVAVGDYDNDGWQDIYVASVTGNHLYRNNGDGTFTDVTKKAGVGGASYKGVKMWSAAAGWVDYN